MHQYVDSIFFIKCNKRHQ